MIINKDEVKKVMIHKMDLSKKKSKKKRSPKRIRKIKRVKRFMQNLRKCIMICPSKKKTIQLPMKHPVCYV